MFIQLFAAVFFAVGGEEGNLKQFKADLTLRTGSRSTSRTRPRITSRTGPRVMPRDTHQATHRATHHVTHRVTHHVTHRATQHVTHRATQHVTHRATHQATHRATYHTGPRITSRTHGNITFFIICFEIRTRNNSYYDIWLGLYGVMRDTARTTGYLTRHVYGCCIRQHDTRCDACVYPRHTRR